MNREILQNILLFVFGLALILVGIVVFLQSQMLDDITRRVDTMNQSMMESSQKIDDAMMKADGAIMMEENRTMREEANRNPEILNSSASVNFDLSFVYPLGWQVSLYEDDFTSDQQNLRLTSSVGILLIAESSGGPGRPGVNYFEEGFQANMYRLVEAQDPFTESQATPYPNTVKDVGECEAGCPTERYIFTGESGRYEIDLYYTDASYAGWVHTILSSLKEEWEIKVVHIGT